MHEAIIEQGQLDLIHVQADEIRVKARGMVAWMGLQSYSFEDILPSTSNKKPVRANWLLKLLK